MSPVATVNAWILPESMRLPTDDASRFEASVLKSVDESATKKPQRHRIRLCCWDDPCCVFIPKIGVNLYMGVKIYSQPSPQRYASTDDEINAVSKVLRNTRFYDLLKIVTMSGQCAWPGLQLNYFLHSSNSHNRMGDQFSTSSVEQLWLLITEFFVVFCVLTCSTTLLGGGIF